MNCVVGDNFRLIHLGNWDFQSTWTIITAPHFRSGKPLSLFSPNVFFGTYHHTHMVFFNSGFLGSPNLTQFTKKLNSKGKNWIYKYLQLLEFLHPCELGYWDFCKIRFGIVRVIFLHLLFAMIFVISVISNFKYISMLLLRTYIAIVKNNNTKIHAMQNF